MYLVLYSGRNDFSAADKWVRRCQCGGDSNQMKYWQDYFGELAGFRFADWFQSASAVWEPLGWIGTRLSELRISDPPVLGSLGEGVWITGPVWIGEGTQIEPGVFIKGPAWIGSNCQIRHNAYIRENSVIGDGCVIGNSTEVKNSILIGGCEVPHFNYVGDSILGWKAHLGAGVILSNYKQTSGTVSVVVNGEKVDTGLRKFGAILGDKATIGCNSVLNPGSLIGPGSIIYPNCSWRGVLPGGKIVKVRSPHEIVDVN